MPGPASPSREEHVIHTKHILAKNIEPGDEVVLENDDILLVDDMVRNAKFIVILTPLRQYTVHPLNTINLLIR